MSRCSASPADQAEAAGESPGNSVSQSDLASIGWVAIWRPRALLRECSNESTNPWSRSSEHAVTLHDLALIAARGDFHSAESLLRQAGRSAGRARHPVVAVTLNTLPRNLRERRYDEAASSLESALNIARTALRPNHQLIAIYSVNLASVRLAQQQPAAAEPLLREGLRIRTYAPGLVPSRRRTFVEDDWSIGATKSLLGASLVALGRYDDAERVLLEAEHDLQSSPAVSDAELRTTRTRLVDLYVAWRKADKASAYRVLLQS